MSLAASFERQLAALAEQLDPEVIRDCKIVARQVVELVRPLPLDVTVLPWEGQALFSFFGPDGFEADVWVNGSGWMAAVFSSTTEDHEQFLQLDEFYIVAAWLSLTPPR